MLEERRTVEDRFVYIENFGTTNMDGYSKARGVTNCGFKEALALRGRVREEYRHDRGVVT